jgi:hypothetical protein
MDKMISVAGREPAALASTDALEDARCLHTRLCGTVDRHVGRDRHAAPERVGCRARALGGGCSLTVSRMHLGVRAAFCKLVVEWCGGRIWIEDACPETMFCIWIENLAGRGDDVPRTTCDTAPSVTAASIAA